MATLQKYKLGQANTFVGTQTIKNTLYGSALSLHIVTINAGGTLDPAASALPRGNLIAECTLTGGVVEAIVNEINPLAYCVGGVSSTNAGGNLYLVTDAKVSSSDLQHRIRQIGANTAAVRSTGIWSANAFTYGNTAISERCVDISGTQVVASTGGVGFVLV